MASKYLQKFPVPENFPEILHDFAREILRDQPEDILKYGYEYFKARDEGLDFDYQNKGKNIPPAASRKVEGKAGKTEALNKPSSRVSSAKETEQEAKKYVNDMIEKLSQDDEDENNEEEN
mmetsp:Transcript_3594/g.4396  ORF Transcript_3594/g.4396 Transcript_3594/m.4396 type:complete len:120 (-) Transcript_3594:45-404(-)